MHNETFVNNKTYNIRRVDDFTRERQAISIQRQVRNEKEENNDNN